MIFYVKCPSCSTILGKSFGKYSEELKSINDNPNLSTKQKVDQSSSLLDKYNYKNICCKVRILGTIPYHEIIVT